MDFEQANSLKEMFHYDPVIKTGAALRKGLEEFRFLVVVSIEAMKCLKDGDLERFDALVGENACQIRAVKVAIVASGDLSYINGLLEDLKSSLEKTNLLLNESINSLMQNGFSLAEVIDQNDLDVIIHEDAMFCIQAFVLAEMKETLSEDASKMTLCKQERSVPKKLSRLDPKMSSSFLKHFAGRLKKLLSEASLSFVKKVAYDLDDSSLQLVLTESIRRYNARACSPMFWTYKALLLKALEAGIPILIHAKFIEQIDPKFFDIVDEKFVYFKVCTKTKKFVKCGLTRDDLLDCACIFEGAVCMNPGSSGLIDQWPEKFNQCSVFDTILAGAADHRQYPDLNDVPSIDDVEFKKYKEVAIRKGFSLDNPSTFFIRHVYPSQVGKKVSSLKPESLSLAV